MNIMSTGSNKQQRPKKRKRNELCRLYSKRKSRNSMIRIALAPRTTRSGKVFDSRRYSTLKNLSNLIVQEELIANETAKSLSETGENKIDENKSTSKVQEDNNLLEKGILNAKQTAEIANDAPNSIVIQQRIGNEEQNMENDAVNIVKENDAKPLVGRNNKRRAEPIKVDVHPSLKLLPKVACIKISTHGNEKNGKTVRWADDNGQGTDGLSQIKEFEEEKPRRRCTMFHKVHG